MSAMLFASIFPRAQRASTFDISAERNVWLSWLCDRVRSSAILWKQLSLRSFAILWKPAFNSVTTSVVILEIDFSRITVTMATHFLVIEYSKGKLICDYAVEPTVHKNILS